MSKTTNFTGAVKLVIEQKRIGKFVSDSGKSSFRIKFNPTSEEFEVLDVVVTSMLDMFTIEDLSVEDFIEKETKRLQDFKDEHMPKEDELRQLDLNGLIDILVDFGEESHAPIERFQGRVEDKELRNKVRRLNSRTTIGDIIIYGDYMPSSIKSSLSDELSDEKKDQITAKIETRLREDMDGESYVNKIYHAEELVDIVNIVFE